MGAIRRYLEEDHARLDAFRHGGHWWEFRGGLFRHIGIEEKILLPDARRRSGDALPQAARLREDHTLLVALLVPAPSPQLEAAIERILTVHNAIEEGDAGVYARYEALVGSEADAIAARMRAAAQTPQRQYQDGPLVQTQIERALAVLRARSPQS